MTQCKLAEYIWLDGYGELRSKIRVLEAGEHTVSTLPVWNFDGSSTRQGSTEQSEIILKPVAKYDNPFHKGGYLVLCETYIQDEQSGNLRPHQTNQRYKALDTFQYSPFFQPWFGIEQEYYIITPDLAPATPDPRNRNVRTAKSKQVVKHYCGVNNKHSIGRKLAERHMYACIGAGLKVSGINAEVGQNQWEYQIGPVEGIEAADQLWVSRYIMHRVAEDFNLTISFHPKPLGENEPGSGCHINFSTVQMRLAGGYNHLLESIKQLIVTHSDYIKLCGDDSVKRLTGDHETAMMANFSWGIGSRNTSLRVPKETFVKQCGYFEDRRPSANMDPYKLCPLLLESVIPKQ